MKLLTNIVVAGVGGQGVVSASDIIADAAFRSGHNVKKAEVHGMAQRGGSVACDVRFGKDILSPMIPRGEADYLVVLQEDQLEVNRHLIKADGKLLTASSIPSEVASQLPPKTLNVALLGLLSIYLDLPEDAWRASLKNAFRPQFYEANDTAFEAGRNLGRSQ